MATRNGAESQRRGDSPVHYHLYLPAPIFVEQIHVATPEVSASIVADAAGRALRGPCSIAAQQRTCRLKEQARRMPQGSSRAPAQGIVTLLSQQAVGRHGCC